MAASFTGKLRMPVLTHGLCFSFADEAFYGIERLVQLGAHVVL